MLLEATASQEWTVLSNLVLNLFEGGVLLPPNDRTGSSCRLIRDELVG